MKNFQVTAKEDGKKYWISRASAVAAIIRAIKISVDGEREIYFLASKRGNNCPDNIGKWQCTCGYVDYDETRAGAISREIEEELGLSLHKAIVSNRPGKFNIYNFQELMTDDSPSHDARQNIVTRYLIDLNYDYVENLLKKGVINTDTESRGGEKGEVDEIKLIPAEEVSKYDWAFNHHDLVRKYVL